MASINSLMSSSTSSTSSIYGNSNVISGLASGLDTEAMIENAVSGIKNKIASFNQNMVMLEWEQSAYRSIIDKMVNFTEKYLSFTSSSNLLSTAFFDSATKNVLHGTYANRLSVSGKTSSDIEILAATKATTATYSGIGLGMSLEAKCAELKAAAGEGAEFNKSALTLTMADLGLIDGEKVQKTDAEGNVVKDEDGNDVMVDQTKTLTVTVGTGENAKTTEITVGASDTVSSVLQRISKESGVEASYSATTGKFYLKGKETGEAGNFQFSGDLADGLFGASAQGVGTDASLKLNINGEEVTKNQSGNEFNIDGMKITVKDSFAVADGESGVTFETTTDTDKIVNAIKSMVEDFNTMANEIKDAYTTKPLTQSNGKKYKPLTEEDAADMSENEVKKYEEKAKTGLLFADRDLSGLYDELRSAISDIGLEKIGISTAYENGKTTLKIDEDKLRNVVENDLDAVKEAFTAEPSGTSRGGLMYNLQKTAEKYTKTTGSQKGILIELAGSEKAATSLTKNDYKTKMDMLQEQITRWQEKLSDKVDYYTRQFTALEKLISEMNSQSSALYGMMGY
ncbi:MAG: flagellar filament capping protein FliD [Oscillospiraceae bacterium]|nr:flagellar filament capping protein FliD [Oscillospiraceae bacterium]